VVPSKGDALSSLGRIPMEATPFIGGGGGFTGRITSTRDRKGSSMPDPRKETKRVLTEIKKAEMTIRKAFQLGEQVAPLGKGIRLVHLSLKGNAGEKSSLHSQRIFDEHRERWREKKTALLRIANQQHERVGTAWSQGKNNQKKKKKKKKKKNKNENTKRLKTPGGMEVRME